MEEKDYQPINCDVYDLLEASATRGEAADLVFTDEGGKEQNLTAKIKTIQTRGKEEYAILEDAVEIRLDRIRSLNGVEVQYSGRG